MNNKTPYFNNEDTQPIINPVHEAGLHGEPASPSHDDFSMMPPYDAPGRQFAMVGMILGICSIGLALISGALAIQTGVATVMNVLSIISGIGGIILGVMGGNQNAAYGVPRGGMAAAGLVCGIIGLVLGGLAFACIGCCHAILR